MNAKQIADELVKLADACAGTSTETLLCAVAGGLEADRDLNGPWGALFMKTLLPKVELLLFLSAAALAEKERKKGTYEKCPNK